MNLTGYLTYSLRRVSGQWFVIAADGSGNTAVVSEAVKVHAKAVDLCTRYTMVARAAREVALNRTWDC